MFARLLMLALVVAAAGCGASTDGQGHVITDRVWFDQAGVAHCPHPDCTPPVEEKEGGKPTGVTKFVPKLRPTDDETEKSIVLPHKNVCEAGHPVTWAAEDVICWSCNGARTCKYCKGTGVSASGKNVDCPGCLALGDGTKTSTGICGECGGKGTLRHGGAWNVASSHDF